MVARAVRQAPRSITLRPSRATASLQLGRLGIPDACFAQAETGRTVGRPARQRFGVEPSEPLNTGWSKNASSSILRGPPLVSGTRLKDGPVSARMSKPLVKSRIGNWLLTFHGSIARPAIKA